MHVTIKGLKELMKSIKKIIKYIFWLYIVIWIGFFCFFGSDMKMGCLDIGQIYDPVQKKCRSDCLTWDDEIGCIPITQENIEKKEKGLL